mgnify:FL=1
MRQTPGGGQSGHPDGTPVPAAGTVLDALTVGVIACDATGQITLANRMAQELLTAPAGDGDAATPQLYQPDGVTPLPADRWPLAVALATGAAHEAELVVATPDAARRIRVSSTPLGSTGAVTTLVDLTEQRRRERMLRVANTAMEQLEQTNATLIRSLAELESFAAVASHDLKSPLATVAGYVELLTHLDPELRSSAVYDEYLAPIGKAVTTMQTLIDDLLTYATAPQAPITPVDVDLGGMVREIVAGRERYLRHQGRPLPRFTVGDLPTVVADPAMLRQVMENLIDNAVKYTALGTVAQVEVTGSRDVDGTVLIEVADRGIGIPAGQHDAVFGDFHRAHPGYPGTGLGLAICQRIIRRHNGTIGARPNRGGGTRFWFTL